MVNYLTLYYNHLGIIKEISSLVDEYLDFISNLEEVHQDCHHIMPRCCGYHTNSFCARGEIGEVNCGEDWWEWCDTDENKKYLSIAGHRSAHQKLTELFPEHEGFKVGYISFYMYNRGVDELSEEEYEERLRLFRDNAKYMHTPESRQKALESLKDKFGPSMSQLHIPEAILKRKHIMIEKYGHANGNTLTEEARRKSSETRKRKYAETNGLSPRYIEVITEKYGGLGKMVSGRIRITNGVDSKFIPPDELIPDGWRRGFPEDFMFITDGVECRRVPKDSVIPEGWRRGNINATTKGLVRVTDGKSIKFFNPEEVPEGWHGGIPNLKAKDSIWIHDSNGNTRMIKLEEGQSIPEGWSKGRGGPVTHSAKGRFYIHKGEETRMIKPGDEIPEGWVKGRGTNFRHKKR